MKLLRVFPRRTSYTPQDALAVIGDPGLFEPPPFDAIAVSCVFTWDKAEAERLRHAWAERYPDVSVMIGGPAFAARGAEFCPGRFVKRGVSISSRGCPGKCPWCFVPSREGPLRLLPIATGNIINDNNVLAWPRVHFEKLCQMLQGQRRIRFAGGFEASRLTVWHIERLRRLSIEEVFFAADHDRALPAVRKASRALGLSRRKMRCYVLIGYKESIDQAARRLENVWDAGLLPFAQLYRDPYDSILWMREWKMLARKWSRPAMMKAAHKTRRTI